MTENEIPSTGLYRVIKSEGAQCWYVERIADHEIGQSFRTKRDARKACATRNLPADMKDPATVRAVWAATR